MQSIYIENHKKASVLMLLSVLGSSIMMMFVKLLSVDFNLVEIIFFRSFIALIFYVVIGQFSLTDSIYHSKNIKTHLLHTFLGVVAMFYLYRSFAILPVCDATAISFSTPLFVSFFAYFFLKEKLTLLSWLVILAGFSGVMIVISPSASMLNPNAIYPIASSVCCALALLCLRRLGGRENSITTSFYYSLFSCLILLPILPFVWVRPTNFDLFLLCILGLGGGIEQLLATQSFQYAPASFLSPISFTAIIWNSFFAYMIWGEAPRTETVIGVIIILTSTFCLIRQNIKNKISKL